MPHGDQWRGKLSWDYKVLVRETSKVETLWVKCSLKKKKNMGKSNSKTSQNSGDPQVNIQNQLEVHEEYHQVHELKLTIILCVVLIQLVVTLYKMCKRYSRTQALKIAKSVVNLSPVWKQTLKLYKSVIVGSAVWTLSQKHFQNK